MAQSFGMDGQTLDAQIVVIITCTSSHLSRGPSAILKTSFATFALGLLVQETRIISWRSLHPIPESAASVAQLLTSHSIIRQCPTVQGKYKINMRVIFGIYLLTFWNWSKPISMHPCGKAAVFPPLEWVHPLVECPSLDHRAAPVCSWPCYSGILTQFWRLVCPKRYKNNVVLFKNS